MASCLDIVFMGTPDFAVPPLKALVEAGHNVQLVMTQPDRPKGRGKKLVAPPVKTVAEELDLPVFQPENVKEEEVAEKLEALNPDLFVVVAYGHILPVRLLEIPRIGPINIHASLLPRHRGAAPIQWAVANGDAETGVTTMFMDKGMDTGDMLVKRALSISMTDTASTMHDKLADLGARTLLETIEGLLAGIVKPVPQNHEVATVAPMLTKEDGRIDWTGSSREIDSRLRGMTPWPGAFTFNGEKRLKIFRATPMEMEHDLPPGTVMDAPDGTLLVAAGTGAISIEELQGDSGKRMDITAYLRGATIPSGTKLG